MLNQTVARNNLKWEEDDGYLIFFVHDENTGYSFPSLPRSWSMHDYGDYQYDYQLARSVSPNICKTIHIILPIIYSLNTFLVFAK